MLLEGGATLAEASDRLRIARATASNHLRAVFRKTGTNRQSELIRLLASLALNWHG